MKLRLWAVALGVLVGLGVAAGLIALLMSTTNPVMQTLLVVAPLPALLLVMRRVEGGAALGRRAFLALALVGACLGVLFFQVGGIGKAAIGAPVIAFLVVLATGNRPARATSSASRVLPLPLEAAFDAAHNPSARPAHAIEVRDLAQQPNGGASVTYVMQQGERMWTADQLDTEFDRPHRVVTETVLRQVVDGAEVEIGGTTTTVTFTAVARGTRVQVTQAWRQSTGGLYACAFVKLKGGRRLARQLEQIGAVATTEAAPPGERVADPEAGPYLQPDD